MNSPQSEFISQLCRSFPQLHQQPLEELVSENLISYFDVRLDKKILQQAQEFISAIYRLRETKAYQEGLQSAIAEKGLQDPGNKSIVMSYDFHIDEEQGLKLIEINTNAAFLLLGEQMYQSRQLPPPVPFSTEDIRKMILEELRLQGKDIASPNITIIDEKPKEQRLYIEFLAYHELFKSWGWSSEITDFRDLFKKSIPDFVYNRHTDFFLADEDNQLLKEKFLSRELCLSPNPYEYLLLADKQRMIDWVSPGYLDQFSIDSTDRDKILAVVPACMELGPENAQDIWQKRKGLFFKPKNAFGSKQSYKGASISRKAFDSIIDQDMIAQEYIPAPERLFETPQGPEKFKYDLRFYTYQDQLQLVVARIYQGQVTNLRTTYGGFAPVIFE